MTLIGFAEKPSSLSSKTVHILIKDCLQCRTNRFLKLSISMSVQWLALARSSLANGYPSCTLVHRFVPQLHRGQVNNSVWLVTFWWGFFGTVGLWPLTGKAVDRRVWENKGHEKLVRRTEERIRARTCGCRGDRWVRRPRGWNVWRTRVA